MPSPHTPPIQFDPDQRAFLGLEYRALLILAGAAGGAVAALTALAAWPLFLRVALAVLCVGLGLALAFGRIEGQQPEAWLWEALRFRRRPRTHLKGAARLGLEPTVDWAREAGQAAEAEPLGAASAAAAAPDFFGLSANAIGAAVLAALGVWLAQGGAHALELMLKTF